MNNVFIMVISLGLLGSCSSTPNHLDANTKVLDAKKTQALQTPHLIREGENHFSALKQLTFGGENAEAYFNAQGTELIFQSTRDGFQCDQIFRMDTDGKDIRLVSTGLGRTTCGYLFPQSPKLIYSSSHKTLKYCPAKPDYSRGYVWPLLADLDIYVADDTGANPTALSPHPGYDAEGVISPTGDAILFTSTRGGDIDIWIMDPDGTNAKQLTNEIGYDGGAFFSYDGTKIVYRANHPNEKKALEEYQSLLAEDLVRPSVMDLFVMNRDGSNKTNIVSNGAANFAPYFHPDGKRIIFSSNMDDPQGRNFDLYIVNVDGSGLERVTYEASFDAFPMFSNDGKQLVFSSNRGAKKEGDTNIFIAEWTDERPKSIALSKGSKTTWLDHTKILSSEKMAGRGIGTKGLKQAEVYLANQLAKMGYEATQQTFFVDVAVAVESSVFSIKKGTTTYLPTSKDLLPFSFSGDGNVEGDILFAGYGDSGHDTDAYKGQDSDGKIVFVFTDGSGGKYAAINAKHHGAKAIVLINNPRLVPDKVHEFETIRGGVNIPVLNMTWTFANKIFGDLKPIHDAAIGKVIKQPKGSFYVHLETKIKRKEIPATNIIARLEGDSNEKNRRNIVVGAHFDHLGFGGEGSLSPDEKTIHPGADDNASGVATVLEIASQLKTERTKSETKFKRDIVFVFFSGEESGLLGSQYFVSDPNRIKAVDFMLNFDMIGRMRENRVNIMGTATAVDLVDSIRRAQVGLGVNINMSPDGFGPSDQSSFFAKRVPVLHFFTGLHEDYHRPSDTFEKLNPDGAEKIGTLALRIITELADKKEIRFSAVKSTQKRKASNSRNYGAYFGSIPSFGKQPDSGVLLSGTRVGSPADKAGVKGGDIIVKFGKYEVRSMAEYAFAIRKYKSGEKVIVVVERGGIQIKLNATLGEKKKKSPHKNPHK